jgi:hypothetical protein
MDNRDIGEFTDRMLREMMEAKKNAPPPPSPFIGTTDTLDIREEPKPRDEYRSGPADLQPGHREMMPPLR